MSCRLRSVPPARCCSTCATRRSRRCRTSARCRSRSAPMRWCSMRPRAATSSSMQASPAIETATLFAVHRSVRHRHGLARSCGAGSTARSAISALLRRRYQAIAALAESRRFEPVREWLRGVGDIERILARVSHCARRARATWCSCAPHSAASAALRAAVAAIDSPLLAEAAREHRRARASERCWSARSGRAAGACCATAA